MINKKVISYIYYAWIVLSIVISLGIIVTFYPNYEGNEFPLATDITLLLFLPAFFIIVYLCTHIFIKVLTHDYILGSTESILIYLCVSVLSFLISLRFMEFLLFVEIILSLLSIIVALAHNFITWALNRATICEG